MTVSFWLLISLFVVLGLAWLSYRGRKPARAGEHVYFHGAESPHEPDSDADMQEQYQFRKQQDK